MGLAEISSLGLFTCEGDHNLLDGGAAVMLTGSALIGLGRVRHHLKATVFGPVTRIPTRCCFVHKLLIASDICTSGAFGDHGSDGLSYTPLFREKNCAKRLAKYQLF